MKKGNFTEVIIATGANLDGESTALYLQELLVDFPGKITQLARGLPTGSSLDYASNAILNDALQGRQTLKKSRKGQATSEFALLLLFVFMAFAVFFSFS